MRLTLTYLAAFAAGFLVTAVAGFYVTDWEFWALCAPTWAMVVINGTP